jgi:L-asparaginase / beta-aspartyl-peptidase
VKRSASIPALIAHGGAGGRPAAVHRPGRKRFLIEAVQRGAEILRDGGIALDAVIATIVALEDAPLFNAGYGSVLTTDGRIEMDAAVMVAERTRADVRAMPVAPQTRPRHAAVKIRAGGVVLVSRVRNPILLARAVMERTPHVLMGGAGAERLAREAGIARCRPEQLISQRAREGWLTVQAETKALADEDRRGTVGAVAVDAHGNLAAATSTGGVGGKLPGRIGDSAIIGAGLFADANGAASATGTGEAIMQSALCREVVIALARASAQEAAARAIDLMYAATGRDAGVITVNSAGRFGYAHNAQAMEIAMFDPLNGVRHLIVEPLDLATVAARGR